MAAAGAFALSSLAPRAEAATRLKLVPLAGRLSLVEGGAANILVASSGQELVLVDGGAAADAKALQQLLDQHYRGQKLRAVFNTHWHLPQSGFNATARARGADVIAHENTRLWLSTRIYDRWNDQVIPPNPAAALPNRSFIYDAQKLPFGSGVIEYARVDPAHTDGDIWVRFPEENVIAVGDLLAPGRYPVIDVTCGGWLGGINAAQRVLAGMADAGTKLVAGTGAVVGVDVLKQQQEMCAAVATRMAEIYRKGGSFAEFVATAPTRDFDAKYGDPARFLKLGWEAASYQANPSGGLSTGQPGAPGGRPAGGGQAR